MRVYKELTAVEDVLALSRSNVPLHYNRATWPHDLKIPVRDYVGIPFPELEEDVLDDWKDGWRYYILVDDDDT